MYLNHSPWRPSYWGFLAVFGLCLCLYSAHLALALSTEEVRNFVGSQATMLEQFIAHTNDVDRGNGHSLSDALIHDDPLACRFCRGASWMLILALKDRFPGQGWKLVLTKRIVADGFRHTYIYSRKLKLIIDPTYRQFLTQIPTDQFARLPSIFVGPREEFRRLVGLNMMQDSIDNYFSVGLFDELPKLHPLMTKAYFDEVERRRFKQRWIDRCRSILAFGA